PLLIILSLILTGCQAAPVQSQDNPTQVPSLVTDTPEKISEMVSEVESTTVVTVTTTREVEQSSTFTPQPTIFTQSSPTPRPTLGPDDWQELPIFPGEVSKRMRDVYQQGLAMGNDPTHFSKLGDCQNITTYFLAIYDNPDLYTLGEQYQPLQETIDFYAGSWSRQSMSVKGGFNVASVLNPMHSNREFCEKNEAPLACELRLHKPSIVLISMEEWWNGDTEKYESYLRRIVETVIDHGAVPILATKADNMEGDHSINKAIANLAYEYELPLWNFWAAVQPITSKGLQKDGFHLTHGVNNFTSSSQLKRGWVQRNLTALQVVDAVWRALETP
ncbi:MAG TPA: hypothetical protein VK856_00590, partial [Anaerolineaceae bacterium]|nr:hypothetical protein [Anaerolineaceae bacterium]